METRVPADEGPWPPARPVGYGTAPVPAPGPSAGTPPAPGAGPADDLAARLAAIERRLDALEGSIRDAVAQEVQGTVDELRRAVSDLGRLLLRDLDRLTKVLADHRDAIVDRLQPVAQPGPAADPAADVAADGTADGAADGGPTTEPAGDVAENAEPAPLTGEEGRWRTLPGRRKRRRSPQVPGGGDTRVD